LRRGRLRNCSRTAESGFDFQMGEWCQRDPLTPAEELKFLKRLVAESRIVDSSVAAYVKGRIRVLEEQLKKAGKP
jgi:hypothetical protein